MPTNLEIKARIKSVGLVLRTARKYCTVGGVLSQTDTYFNVNRGRLKLREFSRTKAELIYYERNEGKGERWSKYFISPVQNPALLKNLLTNALGMRVIVRKSRRLFFYRGARIHIDSVFRLGHFIEVEAIVTKSMNEARSVFAEIIQLFTIEKNSSIDCSYADLLEKGAKKNGSLEKKARHAGLAAR